MRYLSGRLPVSAYIMGRSPSARSPSSGCCDLRVFQRKGGESIFPAPVADLTRLVVGGAPHHRHQLRARQDVTGCWPRAFRSHLDAHLASFGPASAPAPSASSRASRPDGVHYAMGYCFAGISWAPIRSQIACASPASPRRRRCSKYRNSNSLLDQAFPGSSPSHAGDDSGQDRQGQSGFPISTRPAF